MATSPITIAGAGSVGCYIGGCLALGGRAVTLLGRPDLMHAIALNGLRISDCDGRNSHLASNHLATTTDPVAALSQGGVILVTVKSPATATIADLIARHTPRAATVVSLQNGTGNAETLRRRLGTSVALVDGIVPFNIVQTREPGDVPHMHRATSGRIHIADVVPRLAADLTVPGAPFITHSNMAAVSWGKLILNLNNALNALSGLPLREELADRRWRRILAAMGDEALAALKAARLPVARIDGVDPRMMPFGLRLPDVVFRAVARSLLSVDTHARSSMWDDLQRRRPTEIAHLQGAIIDLAAKVHTNASVNKRVYDLIRAAEAAARGAPGLSPQDVAGTVVKLE